MASVTEIVIRVEGQDAASKVLAGISKEVSGLDKATVQAGKSTTGFGSAMQVAVGIGLAQAPAALGNVISGFTGAAQTGAQLELQTKKANTVFGDQIGVINAWASENAHAMGLTKTEATNAAAGFADLLIPMGFTREEGAKMSSEVIGLAGALSEWSGGTRSAADVGGILAKAMLGERDALKELGISISAEEVQARLLEKGQQDLTGQQLAQAEATATQELIFEKSKDAQTAFANGADSAARQTSELKARQKELSEEMASKSLPLMLKLQEGFTALPGPMQSVIFAGKGVLGALGPMSPAFMGLMQMGPKIGPMVTGLGGAFKGLGATMLTPPMGVVLAVTALAAAGYLLYQNWDKIWPVIQKVGEAIMSAFTALPGLFGEAWDKTVSFFTETVPNWIKDNWPQILIGVFTGIPGLVLFHFRDKLWEIAQTDVLPFFTSTIPTWVKDNWPQILITMFTGIPGLVLFHFKDKLWAVFQTDVLPLFTDTIPNWFRDNWVPIVVTVLTGGAGTLIYAFRDTIATKATEIGGALLTAAAGMGNKIRDGLVGGIKGTLGAIGDITTQLWDAIKGIINSAIQAINDAIPNEIKISIPLAPDIVIDLPDNPIPMLAKGGIVTRPTLALLGERGYPEAVVPLPHGASALRPLVVNFNGPMLGDRADAERFASFLRDELGFLRAGDLT